MCGSSLLQRVDDLLMFREPLRLVLRKDQLTLRLDVEDTVGPFDELGVEAKPLLDLGRQTGDLGQVVSTNAVRNGDVHVRN